MYGFLLAVHITACLFLILIVLLQAGKGAGLAVFGGGGGDMFSSQGGSSALRKATAFMASTFAMTSLLLTLLSSRPGMQSVTGQSLDIPIPQSQPAQEAQEPAKGE